MYPLGFEIQNKTSVEARQQSEELCKEKMVLHYKSVYCNTGSTLRTGQRQKGQFGSYVIENNAEPKPIILYIVSRPFFDTDSEGLIVMYHLRFEVGLLKN